MEHFDSKSYDREIFQLFGHDAESFSIELMDSYFDPKNFEHWALLTMNLIAFGVCLWGAMSDVE